jgi:amino acid transporter
MSARRGKLMGAGPTDMLVQFIPLFVLSLIFASPLFNLAKALGKNPWVTVLISFIPVVGFIFVYFVLFDAVANLAERLKRLEGAEAFR